MKCAVTGLLMCTLVLAVLPAVAEQPPDQSDDQAINEMARVVTGNGHQAECLASVVINRVDGERHVMPAPGFEIEPGIHSINGQAVLDTTKCRPLDDNQQLIGAVDLEVNFEAGKTYHIAYDRSGQSSDEWKLIVWKVEQAVQNLSEDLVQP
jgi:hypothetical protein